MPDDQVPATTRQLRSLVTADGSVELSIVRSALPVPAADEVLVRVEATPINPSDLGLLLAAADPVAATVHGSGDDLRVRAPIPPGSMAAVRARIGVSTPVGNEGAGTVVAAGDSPAAQALLGRTVAVTGGGLYGEHRAVPVPFVIPLPEGTTARQGASAFVNPMTVLCMIETMRREGHAGLVHTAAASNLGRMLNRACVADGIPLVNVVRRPDQADGLRRDGAVHVCVTGSPTFDDELLAALAETQATLAFDAVGGGDLLSRILTGMERAATADAVTYERYGSTRLKQGYVYGSLDRGPIALDRTFGMAWSVGGWLLTTQLGLLDRADVERLGGRVATELGSTFASAYTGTVALDELLDRDVLAAAARQATGGKLLVEPHAAAGER